jgi:hypothetical protein
VGKPGGNRLLGRPTRRRMENITKDIREAGWSDTYWIDLAQGREY